MTGLSVEQQQFTVKNGLVEVPDHFQAKMESLGYVRSNDEAPVDETPKVSEMKRAEMFAFLKGRSVLVYGTTNNETLRSMVQAEFDKDAKALAESSPKTEVTDENAGKDTGDDGKGASTGNERPDPDTMTQEQLIAALTQSGTTFDPNASKEALLAALKAVIAMGPAEALMAMTDEALIKEAILRNVVVPEGADRIQVVNLILKAAGYQIEVSKGPEGQTVIGPVGAAPAPAAEPPKGEPGQEGGEGDKGAGAPGEGQPAPAEGQ
jgi:hypothetical protein